MKFRALFLITFIALMLSSCARGNPAENSLEKNGDSVGESISETVTETAEESTSEETDDTLSTDNYYLSITGSFNDDENILSEVYAVYDFSEKTTEKLLSVEATSTYPCGVCDLKNSVVYYSAAEETDMGGRTVMLDNVYSYDLNTRSATQITDYGYYMNRLIPIGGKLYFAGGRRSSAAVEFGWIDLSDNTVSYPDCYSDVKTINVRDIAYACEDEAVYVSWYSPQRAESVG